MESYSKNWIKPPCDVAHVDNLNKKMCAEAIVRRDKRCADGSVMSMVMGVRCSFHVKDRNSGELIPKFIIYNTKSLVPWEVALEGKESITKFLNDVR